MTDSLTILTGDCRDVLKTLPDESVQCCVTSPPYWGLRDYGHGKQIGLEKTPEAYVATMVEVFSHIRRVLRPDGTLWLNLGDCYATGAGKVGEHPGGGKQGARWRGDAAR
ncbi:MAG: DNA methyltransferase, partial [Chthoniobacteraceae bacterium]|nr:DNA methyltransferase [Chthoniobacteraceae bacterium]